MGSRVGGQKGKGGRKGGVLAKSSACTPCRHSVSRCEYEEKKEGRARREYAYWEGLGASRFTLQKEYIVSRCGVDGLGEKTY